MSLLIFNVSAWGAPSETTDFDFRLCDTICFAVSALNSEYDLGRLYRAIGCRLVLGNANAYQYAMRA
jgi:hypothetical protein